MTPHFVGIDLAWAPKNWTGLAVGTFADGRITVSNTARAVTNEEILAFIRPYKSHPLTIAIDAPTIVPNDIGMRPVEALLQSLPEFQRAHAAPYPANRQRLGKYNGGTPRGEELVDLLKREFAAEEVGCPPFGHTSTYAIEVFPLGAMPRLFGRRFVYKRKACRSHSDCQSGLAELLVAMRGLSDPVLDVPAGLIVSAETGARLKAIEDQTDAVLSAYIAALAWLGKAEALGDTQTGYIVLPLSRSQARESTRPSAQATYGKITVEVPQSILTHSTDSGVAAGGPERASLNWSQQLRADLSSRAMHYADASGAEAYSSKGGTVLFRRSEDGSNHGSFHLSSYAAIAAEPGWQSRLLKAHTQRAALPEEHRSTATELDSCNSSDALLMNLFCFPGFSSRPGVVRLVGHYAASVPEFGVPGRVPLRDKRTDATEIDMKIGEVIVESKLTEADFTKRPKQAVERYAAFDETFDQSRLPQSASEYHGYQLIRNVLCASANGYRFVLMCDARRPDLIRQWWIALRAIRDPQLRDRVGLVLWLELAAEAAPTLRAFLADKYGL